MELVKRWWKVGLIVLGIVVIAWGTRPANAAEADAILGIGSGFNHTAGTVMRVGLQLDRRWYAEHVALSSRSMSGGNVFSVGRIVYWRDGSNFAPFIGMGPVYVLDPPREVLGCSWMWHWKLGAEVARVMQVGYSHDSSADRCNPNQGLDYVSIDFRWRF